jgi:hypothetical protein
VHHPPDEVHPHPHWEAERIKLDDRKQPQRNKYGAPRLDNKKKKIPYWR